MYRSALNDVCSAQTNPTSDLTLTPTLNLTPAQPFPTLWERSKSALEVGRGSIEFQFTCKSEKPCTYVQLNAWSRLTKRFIFGSPAMVITSG